MFAPPVKVTVFKLTDFALTFNAVETIRDDAIFRAPLSPVTFNVPTFKRPFCV